MTFNLEKVDLSKIEALYFLRGYESEDNDDYCTLLVLRGDKENKYEGGPFISRKTLSIKDGKQLWAYLESKGLRMDSANFHTGNWKLVQTQIDRTFKLARARIAHKAVSTF